jgi:hypothetical protein
MPRPTRWTLLGSALAALVAAAPVGCNLLLGGGYVVGASDGSVGPGDGTVGDSGVDAAQDTSDAAPDACPSNPQTKQQLESACTGSTCEPFDNATRNTRCAEAGTACPQVTAPLEAGMPEAAPAEAGVDDGSTDDGSTDAGSDAAQLDSGISCFALQHGPAGGQLPQPIVYATGSTAIQPYMARVAQVLESLGIGSVVYEGAGSCFGVNAMLTSATLPLSAIAGTATYYDSSLDANGEVQSGTCVIDDPTRIADLGVSDVFPTTCDPQLAAQGGLPNNLHDFFGPVQVMEMVVPATSTQTSISAEAAYMVWGFGSDSGVAPWTSEPFLLQRSASSGTQNMIAATIGLPASLWQGTPNATSGALLAAIENVAKGDDIDGGPGDPSNVDKTMGILASDVADSSRQYLKPLAFQDVGEPCGWYPDSTQTSFDKNNVRDGHYPIWGPSHLIAYSDTNGNATNPAVATLIDAMNGTNSQVLATLDIVQFYATSHIVPTCAMHVQRAQDGADYQPYAPPVSCSCYYDLQATGQTTCTKCTTDASCTNAPGGATSCVTFGIPPVGYCEPPG